jgi:hypothetical protein
MIAATNDSIAISAKKHKSFINIDDVTRIRGQSKGHTQRFFSELKRNANVTGHTIHIDKFLEFCVNIPQLANIKREDLIS